MDAWQQIILNLNNGVLLLFTETRIYKYDVITEKQTCMFESTLDVFVGWTMWYYN